MEGRAPGHLPRILFTEGSSTSACQALHALGRLGYRVELLDPQPFCLGRFSRYVRAWHRCPPFASEPKAYLGALFDQLRRSRYDVLLPVHDQVYLLARIRDELQRRVAVALPQATALEQVQSKAAWLKLLDALALPHPPTTVVARADDLRRSWQFPCYIKLAYGTAGTGVWYVRDSCEVDRVIAYLRDNSATDQEILVQQPAEGTFGVTQAVFQHGSLVAAHSYLARAIGVGGSARCRVSDFQPAVEDHLRLLGLTLAWHGALHIEYFLNDVSGRPSYIDANPRIGETMNATLSGTNLCDILVQVSLGSSLEPLAPSRVGVRTHSLLTSLLAAAERGPDRRVLIKETWNAWGRRELYHASQDELTRPTEDWLSAIPLSAVLVRLLTAPSCARSMIRGTVDRYGLTAAAVKKIQELDGSN